MTACRAGEFAEARLRRAVDSLQVRYESAQVTIVDADESHHDAATLEIDLPDDERCPPEVLGALQGERLSVASAQPKATGFRVVAVA